MIYQFDTENKPHATAALLVYAIYRSRDKARFKVSPEMWGQIERFVKASAKRANSLPRFIDALMPRMCCPCIHPRWMEVGMQGRVVDMGGGSYASFSDPQREFLTGVLKAVSDRAVLDALYKETTWVILLVRDRLEREKPIESTLENTAEDVQA